MTATTRSRTTITAGEMSCNSVGGCAMRYFLPILLVGGALTMSASGALATSGGMSSGGSAGGMSGGASGGSMGGGGNDSNAGADNHNEAPTVQSQGNSAPGSITATPTSRVAGSTDDRPVWVRQREDNMGR